MQAEESTTQPSGPSHRTGAAQRWRRTRPRLTRRAHRDHPALGGHEGRPVAEAQLGLQRVEVDLQLALLLHLGRLVQAPVVAEVLQLLLHGVHRVLGRPVLQPRDGTADPLQQLWGWVEARE